MYNISHVSPRVRLPELMEILQCSRSGVYAQIKRGLLPPPYKAGLRFSYWLRDQVELAAQGKDWRQAASYQGGEAQ